MRSLIGFTSVLTVVLSAVPAFGHFVWLQVGDGANGQRQANVYFSETPEPGASHLVDRLKSTEAWACDESGSPVKLELKPSIDAAKEVGGLAGDLPAKSTESAAAKCLYGVFERGNTALLLNYYARHQKGGTAKCPVELPLDIELGKDGDKVTATVTFNGKPAADCEVIVTDSKDESHELKTNAEGKVEFPAAIPTGSCAIQARHTEADKAGEFEGKAYSQVWHIATLTTDLGGEAAGERTATQLLSDARHNRALWNDFPGFRAKVHVAVNGEQREATMVVTPEGDVELKGLDSFGMGFVDRHINSLVMHRMPGAQVEDSGASFEEDDKHVLGRKVRLAEEVMGSVYRINNNVVTEVNRKMGRQNFTISVLDVEYNAENQYLPHIFTVSFWDEKDGNLKSVESVYHTWTRIGKFDLPAKVVVIATGDKAKRDVMKIDFTDLELLDGAPATAQANK